MRLHSLIRELFVDRPRGPLGSAERSNPELFDTVAVESIDIVRSTD